MDCYGRMDRFHGFIIFLPLCFLSSKPSTSTIRNRMVNCNSAHCLWPKWGEGGVVQKLVSTSMFTIVFPDRGQGERPGCFRVLLLFEYFVFLKYKKIVDQCERFVVLAAVLQVLYMLQYLYECWVFSVLRCNKCSATCTGVLILLSCERCRAACSGR